MRRSIFKVLGNRRLAASARGRLMGLSALLALAGLAGCGGDGSGGASGPEALSTVTSASPSVSTVIDANGGSLVGPDGARLDVPAGALAGPVTITMTREATGAPALLDDQSDVVYAITPHGLAFQKPAVLTIPAAQLPGQSAAHSHVLRAQPGADWQLLAQPIDSLNGSASVVLNGLSFYGMAGTASTAPGPRTGVIGTSVSWVPPEPGVLVPMAGNTYRRIVEPTVAKVQASANVDAWCGGSVTITALWLKQPSGTVGYQVVQQQKRTVPVAGSSGWTVFDFDVPTTAQREVYSFGASAVCDNPAPLPPNAPKNVRPPSFALQLDAVGVAAPTITQHPVNAQGAVGDAVSFVVAAIAPDALTVHWQRSDDGGGHWVNTGAQAETYNFVLTQGQLASRWRAQVCNVSSLGVNCRNSVTVKVGAGGPGAPWQADSAIAGSGTHSMAIDSTGTAYSWGTNNGGALGRSSGGNGPSPVAGPAMRSLAAGAWYSVGLSTAGDVYAWGWGGNVGAAIGSTTADNPLPLKVSGLPHVVAIASRYHHTLALTDSGQVWGFGPEDALALGPMLGQRGVRQVPGLAGMRQVAAGERHSLALAADGTVWAWGSNGSGQLGTGAATVGSANATPQAIPGLDDVVQIAAGSYLSIALKRDGSVWTWGDASLIGRGGDATVPAPVPGLTNVVQIAAGHRGGWALQAQGLAYGWGDNRFGQVGVGNNATPVTSPLQLLANGPLVEMAGGEVHSLTMPLTQQGRRVCGFGNNGNLQLDGVAGADANAATARCINLP